MLLWWQLGQAPIWSEDMAMTWYYNVKFAFARVLHHSKELLTQCPCQKQKLKLLLKIPPLILELNMNSHLPLQPQYLSQLFFLDPLNFPPFSCPTTVQYRTTIFFRCLSALVPPASPLRIFLAALLVSPEWDIYIYIFITYICLFCLWGLEWFWNVLNIDFCKD